MFGPFERAVAGRYLRARRGERFVSVIAGFSLVGIALGVATLIIVMSVMGGFQVDLLNRILGFNGHLGVYGAGAPLQDYDRVAERIRAGGAGRCGGRAGGGCGGQHRRERKVNRVSRFHTGDGRDVFARARISRAGCRVAHVLAEAWQDSRDQPIASLTANFLLDSET